MFEGAYTYVGVIDAWYGIKEQSNSSSTLTNTKAPMLRDQV